MYNKVKKCLESMGFYFVECETIEFINGIKLNNGFRVLKPNIKEVYIEIGITKAIDIWDYESGDVEHIIADKEFYVTMFQLACALNN